MRRSLAYLVIIVALGACSAATPQSDPPLPTTTATATPTPTPSDTASVPVREIESIEPDLDGDGTQETLSLAPAGSGKADAVARLSSGDEVRTTLEVVGEPSFAGFATADGQKGDEVFVIVDRGASTEFAVILTYDGTVLRTVSTADGERFGFALNGSVTHGNGMRCRTVEGTPIIQLLRLTTKEQRRYQWQVESYGWRGKSVELFDTRKGTFTAKSDDDPRIVSFYMLVCGPTNYGD